MTKLISILVTLLATSSVQAAVCAGTFNMTSNGFNGYMDINTTSENANRETFQGGITMAGGPTYLVNGACTNGANGGRIQFNVTFPNGTYVSYNGSYFFGATATNMSGQFFDGRRYYPWSAYQAYDSGSGGPGGYVSDCAGDYDIVSNGVKGLLHLEMDSYGGLTGHVTIGSQPTQAVNGVCQVQPNNRVFVSFSRYNGSTSQEYRGYVNVSAAGVHMSGRFTAAGRSYPWHANRH